MARLVRTIPDVEVHVAQSAADARELLTEERYALLITDHQMPGETGVDLLEHVAVDFPETVSILVTAHQELEVALGAINRGHVYALLHKPWRTGELQLSVRRALERHALQLSLKEKITELQDANRMLAESRDQLARLYREASTDPKTGARSYRYFTDRLDEEVARSRRYERALALVLVDLDGFKEVNDTHGHTVGDHVLKDVVHMLRANLRVMDVLARFGGDEFALILPDTDLAGAEILSERLRERVGAHVFEPADPGAITISLGIAAMPPVTADSGEALFRLADDALYEAKHAGRNRFVVARGSDSINP